MITIECPFCDEAIRMDGQPDAVRCDHCRVELEFAADDTAPALAQAA
jgi:primosomal protein N'